MNFKSVPFFRILIPYLTGIIYVNYFGLYKHIHFVFLSVFFIVGSVFLLQKLFKNKFTKSLFIFWSYLFLFISAQESCFLYDSKNYAHHYSHYLDSKQQSFIAIVNDIPDVTQKFIKLSVEVYCIKAFDKWHYSEGTTIIYLKNDSTTTIDLGTKILINGKFSELDHAKNPNEFDYRNYLEQKNIFHTVFITTENIHVLSNKNNLKGIIQFGIRVKAHLISILKSSALSKPASAICTALLVGYDDEIDSDIIQSFSHSGTLHILSVSGAHTGILYGILIFIFSWIDKFDKYKKIKCVVILLFLGFFMVITGLSPSVLRACLMLSLVLLGKTFYKQSNSYNTLLLSAFVLLLFNPNLVKDVGFLLSYFAVFGILYLYPLLDKLFIVENTMLKWLWSIILVSVAATVFTLPISLYYFHQFPIWFALSNLVVIPLSVLIMLSAGLFLLFYKLLFLNQLLVALINIATTVMLWFVSLTDNSKFGYVDFIPFSMTDLVFMSLSLCLFFVLISYRSYKYTIAFCITIICWLSESIIFNLYQKQQNELVVFHIKRESMFIFRKGQTVYGNFHHLSEKDLQRYVKPYLLTISNLSMMQTDCNVIKYGTKTICHVNAREFNFNGQSPDIVIVSNNTPIRLKTNQKTLHIIIADCSNSYKFVKQLKKTCISFGIPFYWTNENSSIKLSL